MDRKFSVMALDIEKIHYYFSSNLEDSIKLIVLDKMGRLDDFIKNIDVSTFGSYSFAELFDIYRAGFKFDTSYLSDLKDKNLNHLQLALIKNNIIDMYNLEQDPSRIKFEKYYKNSLIRVIINIKADSHFYGINDLPRGTYIDPEVLQFYKAENCRIANDLIISMARINGFTIDDRNGFYNILKLYNNVDVVYGVNTLKDITNYYENNKPNIYLAYNLLYKLKLYILAVLLFMNDFEEIDELFKVDNTRSINDIFRDCEKKFGEYMIDFTSMKYPELLAYLNDL